MKYVISAGVAGGLILGCIFFVGAQRTVDSLAAEKSVTVRHSGYVTASSSNSGAKSSDKENVSGSLTVGSDLASKLEQEKLLDTQMASVRIHESINEIVQVLKVKGIELPAHLLERMRANSLSDEALAELLRYVSSALPEGEVDFRKQTLGFGMGYAELSKLYADRSFVTGLNYDQELIGNPQIYKDISVDELDSLMARGTILPAGVVDHITKYQRADLLHHLREKGYLSDLNYISPYTHRNAVEEFSEQYASGQLNAANAGQSLEYLDQLLAVGVILNPNDNTRDALDYAFQNLSATNAGRISLLTKKLIDAGFKIEDSHIELIKHFKATHPGEYEQYMQSIVSTFSKTL